ncbi:GntR family transcriptional regulator / MocR family aminotransferase [Nonomuraea solani]|uniref:GntR family transcriptional regulator / MocR family aminotransferase n=1 Tax=Nonomuraea solani TaxID=1144553 RepID=A0A1H5ZU86_9ACTN|nr:PLP-dependent aminotransferase family protein [Nonomuraea solani]SEG40058.1 GntR family transcriptional regulator / MocR family aminotransferase [Nonomuraea solani]
MRHPQRLNVPIHLDRDLPDPLHDQLAAQLRQAIIRGQLAALTRMPSTRTLADVLGISRGVALAAYETLLAEGYISGRHGSGTYVSVPKGESLARTAPEPAADQRPRQRFTQRPGQPVPTTGPLIDMRQDRPTGQAFPLAAWRAAWRRAGHRPPLDEPPAAGLPELRAAIAAYLRESRGLVLNGHEVVVTAGYGDALELILRAQGGPPPVIALEDPAAPGLRTLLGRLGTVVPLPVDRSGARPDLIPESCDVVAVLPERGNPLGARMPVERRLALAAWARESGGLVLEPAFDGLFNTALSPRPSVLAMGDVRSTAMVGSFCDLLTPTLRLSFAVVPRRLARAVEEGLSGGHGQPSFTCQLAVADLLGSGTVARRAERLALLYDAKRALVRQALGAYPDIRLLGADTGAAATLLLPSSVRAESVVGRLRTRRVQVAELSAYHHPRGVPGNGIVFSYGHLDAITLRRALHAMARTLDDHRLSRRTAA